jgi:putative membrane protein
MMSDWSAWSWGMGFGGVFMILFWALIVLAIVALGKWLFSSTGSDDSGKRPLEILRERYARGEISRAEYERMREDLVV